MDSLQSHLILALIFAQLEMSLFVWRIPKNNDFFLFFSILIFLLCLLVFIYVIDHFLTRVRGELNDNDEYVVQDEIG